MLPPRSRLWRRTLLGLVLAVPAMALSGATHASDIRPGRKPPAPPRPGSKPTPPASQAVVALDPGHGGPDPGAIGPSGILEKTVTLDIARMMAQILTAEHRIQVVLTRHDDRFVPLAERVNRGRKARADLFVSIHADSAPTPGARGISAYTLAGKASDGFAAALAQRENRADTIGGLDLKGTEPTVRSILIDLAARHTSRASLTARRRIIRGIEAELPLLENPMRSANFAVLKAPDMPSVLIETGFLSNPLDEKRLADPAVRRSIARILAREIARVLTASPFA